MTFFTLIHVSETEASIHNNFVTSIRSQIQLYLSCAEQLASELKKTGIRLSIITNNKAYLKSLNPGLEAEVIELTFSDTVPSGINFYSAHFKLQVYNYLSKLNLDYVGLVDSDIVCINPMPGNLLKAIANKIPLYYDITSQVIPAHGEQTIISDKQKVEPEGVTEFWAGGEFIAGPPAFFEKLDKEVSRLAESYFSNFHSLHHQGDEVLTTIALEKLKQTEQILDAGDLNIILRYWSVKPKHTQVNMSELNNYFLLHLPSDKPFIHKSKAIIAEGTFLTSYKNYVIKKKWMRGVFGSMIPLAKRILKSIAAVKTKLGPSKEKLVITSNTNSAIREQIEKINN